MRPQVRVHSPGLLAVAAAALALAACSSPPAASVEAVPPDVGPPTDDATVHVVDSRFEPSEIVVAVGNEVTWTWDARIVHDVTGDVFESDVQSTGAFTHSFATPGAYPFACSLHPGMTGTIYVVEP